MLSTLLSPRGGVMKPQVRCTTARLVRDDKSIQYIQKHHDDGGVIQITPSTPTNLSAEEGASSEGIFSSYTREIL